METFEFLWMLICILAGFYTLYKLRNEFKAVMCFYSLNGPPAVPFLGNVHYAVKSDLIEDLNNAFKTYGKLLRIWITFVPSAVVGDPEDIQLILSSAKHTKKSYYYKFFDNFLGKGLLTTDVDTWKIHRRILQPAFHLQVLQRFTTTFGECAKHFAETLAEGVNRDINIAPFINDAVYCILSETVLGINIYVKTADNYVEKEKLPFRHGQTSAVVRHLYPWLLNDWIYGLTRRGKQEELQQQELTKICKKIMDARRKELYEAGIPANNDDTGNEKRANRKTSLLQFMIEANAKNPTLFDDKDIVEECCTFMLAGQDSVGTATAIAIFLLAKHQDWQDKCYEELRGIFEDDDRSPGMQDLREMKCLEMCVKETLRLYPSVLLYSRTLGEDVKIDNTVLPKGSTVFFFPSGTHRSEKYYSDPNNYNPEHFNSENTAKRHPYAFIPFSAGPRNCIGYKFAMLEIKSLISTLLRKYSIHTVAGKEEIQPMFRVTLRARGGVWVKLVPRT